MSSSQLLNYQFHQTKQAINSPTLVFIHGLFGDMNNLGVIARAFSDNYNILRVDLRNHGQSFHSETMNYDVMADDVWQLIDYLQLITGSSNNRESRQQEVSDISRQLKMLARELDVPVIALSQLSRSVEQRPNKRPMMSDLRESGAIEQDADIVTFIYREGYYKASEGKEEEDNGLTEIIIAKHRNGATGEVNLAFEKNFSRFTDLAPIGPDGSSAGVRDVRG